MLLFAAPLVLTALSHVPSATGAPDRWRTLEVEGLGPIEYVLVTPPGFDASEPYPVVLALPPGGGGRDMVELGLELYFEREALARGWVVVSPAAPGGKLFFAGGEQWIPALLDAVTAEVVVERGRFHLAGPSNGGRGAFRVAGLWPERFASLAALPGVPSNEADWERVAAIAAHPVALYVGAEDAGWREGSVRAFERLSALGAREVTLDVREGEEHVLEARLASELFDRLDAWRAEELERAALREEVGRVLDELHAAAAVADEERYFGCFLPEAVFVGTDASERWSLAQFRAWAAPHFEGDSAWVYEPIERHVELSEDGTLAWFDERLANASYGETRGSGVLLHRAGRWRIAHYVLSFAIPNEAAREVVDVLRGSAR